MPYVNIQVTDEGVTREQKQKIIHGVSQLLWEVLKKDPTLTHIVIQEIGLDNWGWQGETVTNLRAKQNQQS